MSTRTASKRDMKDSLAPSGHLYWKRREDAPLIEPAPQVELVTWIPARFSQSRICSWVVTQGETGHAATVTDRKSRCASESGRAAPSLRMARGSLEQFSVAKGRVTEALEVYLVQRMNHFAVRSLKRPGASTPFSVVPRRAGQPTGPAES